MRFCDLALLVLTVLAIGSRALAADGAALLQVRAKLPNPGTILVEHEDPSTLKPIMAKGSSSQVVAIEKSDAMPLDSAVRVSVGKAYPAPYNVLLHSASTQAPVKKGDTILLSCWLRAPEASGGQSGLATIYVETTGPQWQSPASVGTTCERTWNQVFATGTADRDFPAGTLQVSMHLGQQRQVLDVAGLVVLNLGQGIDAAKLPRTRIAWRGMEADAPWRSEAQRRIEQFRMADLAIQVLDAAGNPVPNTPVHIQQQRRDFTIGSFTGYALVDETADGQKMRDIFLRLFNRATNPIYWADWGWPNQKPKYLAIAKWLTEHHFTVRGHVMVYPGFNFMPAEAVKLKDDPAKLRERILQQVREISQATKPFGFREYDVTNELRDCVDVHKLLGRDAVAEWFAEARQILPDARLALNENTILTSGGITKPNQDLYLDWYRFLKSKGQAPAVMGMQGHFGENVTAPETVLAILDRFAKETDAELQITEFDINTLDEQAQADYTRDFLTICFSHPRVTGFTMWGIWEGDHWLPRAAFYRKDWTPKPNGKVLEELLTKTWWTDIQTTTDSQGRASVKAFLGTHAVSATIAGKPVTTTVALDQAGQRATAQVRP